MLLNVFNVIPSFHHREDIQKQSILFDICIFYAGQNFIYFISEYVTLYLQNIIIINKHIIYYTNIFQLKISINSNLVCPTDLRKFYFPLQKYCKLLQKKRIFFSFSKCEQFNCQLNTAIKTRPVIGNIVVITIMDLKMPSRQQKCQMLDPTMQSDFLIANKSKNISRKSDIIA